MQRKNSVNDTEMELERLYIKLFKLETHLYRRRLSHLKSLRKRVSLIHREIDKAYHDAYQTYEIDMHHLSIHIREFQDDLNLLRSTVVPDSVKMKTFNKNANHGLK